jgi:hypothetical protein
VGRVELGASRPLGLAFMIAKTLASAEDFVLGEQCALAWRAEFT